MKETKTLTLKRFKTNIDNITTNEIVIKIILEFENLKIFISVLGLWGVSNENTIKTYTKYVQNTHTIKTYN